MGVRRIMELVRRNEKNLSEKQKKEILKHIEDSPPEEIHEEDENFVFVSKKRKLSRYLCPHCRERLEEKRNSLFCNECEEYISQSDAVHS